MKSLCLFASYFKEERIPYYVFYYLEELSKHFSEVQLLTNEKPLLPEDLQILEKNNIQIISLKNEGYDFGQWYKALKNVSVNEYERIGLINDSCILFRNLDPVFNWINSSGLDYCGITDSRAVSFHIQSYFLIINKNAIPAVYDYFMQTGIIPDIENVIEKYEIGLSDYLSAKGMKIGARFTSPSIPGNHSPSLCRIEELIQEGIPVIKKKIIFKSFLKGEYLSLFRMNFNIDPRYYIRLIRHICKSVPILDFEKVTEGKYTAGFVAEIYIFRIKSGIYQLARKNKLLKWLYT